MWLEIKEAAGKKPLPLKMLQDQLGSTPDAILYRRLAEDHPEVERGPEETLSDHFSRLQRSQEDWRAKDTTDVKRRKSDPRAKPKVDEGVKTPAWATLKDRHELLPGRNPGWFTGPESESRGFGVPPMAHRTPGESLRPSHAPGYAPEPQSVDDWKGWLSDQGIALNNSGHREEPPRALTGPEIWHPFVGPTTDDSYAQYLRELPKGSGGFGDSITRRVKKLFGPRRVTTSVDARDYIEGLMVDLGEMPNKTAGQTPSWTDER